jgi:hypothetical protein
MSSDSYNPSNPSGGSGPALSFALTTTDEKSECLLFDYIPERTTSSRYQPQITMQLLELGHGAARLDTDRASPSSLSFRNTYRINNYADLSDLDSFFEARLGRNESFCLPSWQADLQLSETAVAGTDYLSVQSHEVSLYQDQNLMFYKSGQYFVRTVAAFGDGYVELNSGIPFSLSPADSISVIYRVTFASDSLTLTHRSNDVVEIELSFVEEIREADQVGEVTDADTDLNAICYLTMTEAQYLLLEESAYALLTTNCAMLGDGDGIVSGFETTGAA